MPHLGALVCSLRRQSSRVASAGTGIFYVHLTQISPLLSMPRTAWSVCRLGAHNRTFLPPLLTRKAASPPIQGRPRGARALYAVSAQRIWTNSSYDAVVL
jgi:hypothetical protein